MGWNDAGEPPRYGWYCGLQRFQAALGVVDEAA